MNKIDLTIEYRNENYFLHFDEEVLKSSIENFKENTKNTFEDNILIRIVLKKSNNDCQVLFLYYKDLYEELGRNGLVYNYFKREE